jgi:hypothetical protein
MNPRALALAFVAVNLLSLASCRRDGAETSASARAGATSADAGSLGAHRPAELDEAARRIIAFLRGEVGFDRIRVADTVTLYISPEGGGTRTKLTREQLRDRSNWKARGLLEYSFVPPAGTPTLTTRVGRHLHCDGEHPLSSRFAELARFPHVGTMLRYGTTSCLQTRNLTLVFDPTKRPPTLVAAVYDQYEW